jgi:cobalt-precorrin-5B (C1)-methyltransferase
MHRPAQHITRGHTVPPRNPQGRREGFTTGTAAAAAAKAACLVLLDRGWPECVRISLPQAQGADAPRSAAQGADAPRSDGRSLDIPINSLEYDNGIARAGVVKDAGDDPDVTHGAEIFAAVRLVAEPGVHIKGGEGVGVVTRPGLELPVGSPAINPVPQQMIRQAVEEALAMAGCPAKQGIEVTISVPRGEELARRTFNPRLGIVGGISILGTTGIVKAKSTAAWRASVQQAIDVAAANGVTHIVLSTGGRTEKFARMIYPELPEMAFVEMGIFTGACLHRAAERGVLRVSLCCMIGKLSKIAAGKLQTHVAGNQVDCRFLAELAGELGGDAGLVAAIASANSARHIQELVAASGLASFYTRLCERAVQQCSAAVSGRLGVAAVLFDFDGRILGQSSRRERGNTPNP